MLQVYEDNGGGSRGVYMVVQTFLTDWWPRGGMSHSMQFSQQYFPVTKRGDRMASRSMCVGRK